MGEVRGLCRAQTGTGEAVEGQLGSGDGRHQEVGVI